MTGEASPEGTAEVGRGSGDHPQLGSTDLPCQDTHQGAAPEPQEQRPPGKGGACLASQGQARPRDVGLRTHPLGISCWGNTVPFGRLPSCTSTGYGWLAWLLEQEGHVMQGPGAMANLADSEKPHGHGITCSLPCHMCTSRTSSVATSSGSLHDSSAKSHLSPLQTPSPLPVCLGTLLLGSLHCGSHNSPFLPRPQDNIPKTCHG